MTLSFLWSNSRLRRSVAAAAFGIAIWSTSACADLIVVEMDDSVEMSTDPQLIQKSLGFGDWALPADGKVLMARYDSFDDDKVNLVVETSPAGLVWMLEHSGYHARFESKTSTFKEALAGPPLDTSPSLLEAQQIYLSPEGGSMLRDVIIDERSPELRIVHIEIRGQ